MPKKGYKRSQKFREKLRQVNLGKKHSKQTRSKISNSLKGHWTGKDNPNWKSGKSKYTTNTIAKIRDDYTCQICGLREPEIMEVDHIKPKARFPELKYNLDNLITLCPNCHKRKTVRERKIFKLGNYK